jgi:hypothetical protein
VLDARLTEHVLVETDAGDLLALERRAELAERIPVLVDDRDRVALVLQDVREGRSDPPATHDHNVHDHPLDEYSAPTRTDVPANGIPCPD